MNGFNCSWPQPLVVGTYNLMGTDVHVADWYTRELQIKQNIAAVTPDILTLQGIRKRAFTDLRDYLSKMGYAGEQAKANKKQTIVAAIFYNTHKFTCQNTVLKERTSTCRSDLYLDLMEKTSGCFLRVACAHIVTGKYREGDDKTTGVGYAQAVDVVRDCLHENAEHIQIFILGLGLHDARRGKVFNAVKSANVQVDDDNTPSCINRKVKHDWIFTACPTMGPGGLTLEGKVYNDLPVASNHHLVTTKLSFQSSSTVQLPEIGAAGAQVDVTVAKAAIVLVNQPQQKTPVAVETPNHFRMPLKKRKYVLEDVPSSDLTEQGKKQQLTLVPAVANSSPQLLNEGPSQVPPTVHEMEPAVEQELQPPFAASMESLSVDQRHFLILQQAQLEVFLEKQQAHWQQQQIQLQQQQAALLEQQAATYQQQISALQAQVTKFLAERAQSTTAPPKPMVVSVKTSPSSERLNSNVGKKS